MGTMCYLNEKKESVFKIFLSEKPTKIIKRSNDLRNVCSLHAVNLCAYYGEMEEEIEEVQSKIDGLSMSGEISSNIADFGRL